MNTYQAQQFWNDINGIIGFTTSIILIGFMVGMVRSFWPEEKYRLVKRTKHASLVTIYREGNKAIIEVPNFQDMADLSTLLNVTGIKWEVRSGISKSAWEGTPAHLRSPISPWHKITDPYPGKTIEFNFADLESVLGQMRLSSLLLEEPKEHHNSSNITTQEAKGTCYEDAWRFLIKEEEGELIHGTVESLGKRIGHAWVELPTGYIWEPQTQGYFSRKDFDIAASPIEEHRYSVEEAAIMVARVGKHGPWTDEERAKWLGKQITVKEIDMDGVFRFEATHIDFPYARGKVVLVLEPNYSIIVGLNVEEPIQRTGVGSTLIMKALEKTKLIGKPVVIEKVTPAGNALLKSMESRGLIKLTLAGEKVDVQAGIGEMVDVGGGKSISASYLIEVVE